LANSSIFEAKTKGVKVSLRRVPYSLEFYLFLRYFFMVVYIYFVN